jgi:putative endonuclease
MNKVAFGRRWEEHAADVVRRAGFEILEQNVRLGALELDLVAKRDELIAIIEVRFRGARALEGPLASITHVKRRRLIRAARALWRTRLRQHRDVKRVRIDVIAITEEKLEWIEGAISADDA